MNKPCNNILFHIWLNRQHDITLDTIPCSVCGEPTNFDGTKLCNNCWEVKRRLRDFISCKNGFSYVLEEVKKILHDRI